MMAWVLMAFGLCKPILDVQQQSLLGKRALLISSDLSSNPRTALTIADHVLAGGASVTLMVPLPQSGAAAQDEAALKLLLRIQRQGFPRLMAELGFSRGVPGQYGHGNRQRLGFKHVRADDVEELVLSMTDADLLLLHTPRIQAPSTAVGRILQDESSVAAPPGSCPPNAPQLSAEERAARFAMHRTMCVAVQNNHPGDPAAICTISDARTS